MKTYDFSVLSQIRRRLFAELRRRRRMQPWTAVGSVEPEAAYGVGHSDTAHRRSPVVR